MNLQLANVISDLSGLTGQRIVRAIIAGEHDAQRLAGFRDPRVKASQEEIAKGLEGNWRPELIFLLQQEMAMYDTYQQRIAECDQQLQKHLTSFADHAHQVRSQSAQSKAEGKKAKKPAAKNAPRFDLSSELERITGVDLTRIDGIDVMGSQTILSEIGLDMGRWKTEAHFASWLGLCPDNRTSGDKVLRRGTRHVVNRAALALRMAANSLLRSQSYLGAQYRRLRTKLGAPKAITAMAHRLARLVYRMLKWPTIRRQRHGVLRAEIPPTNKSSYFKRRPRSSGCSSCRHKRKSVSGEQGVNKTLEPPLAEHSRP
jgi:transposase